MIRKMITVGAYYLGFVGNKTEETWRHCGFTIGHGQPGAIGDHKNDSGKSFSLISDQSRASRAIIRRRLLSKYWQKT